MSEKHNPMADETVHYIKPKQHEALAHLRSEAVRYGRMASRCRELNLPVLSASCREIAKQLANCCELQEKMLLQPEQYLPFSQQTDKTQINK